MLRLYDVDTARQTILRRDAARRSEYPAALLASVERFFGGGVTPEQAVAQIIASVRDEGDAALHRWSQTIDKASLDDFRVAPARLAAAFEALPPSQVQAFMAAAERIRDFHARQPLPNWQTDALGGTLGQRVTPIRRVGIYVPGGSAPLPSSLLMTVIPAQVAGVEQIVVCTPPNPAAAILAVAHICGIKQLFEVGGAQAIAALAFGTESIPRVDKIAGPGNLFVTLAKQQVFGLVGLDGLAGPTETMIIADSNARPAWLAADLLAQAEHEPLATAILLTPDRVLAEAVQAEVARQVERLARAEIIAQSMENNGGIVLTPSLEVAAELANDYAAEHLCLMVAEPQALIELVPNVGGLFIGERSFEVLGDYVAGPSHVMPTGGTARFASPLNVFDFVKITSIIALDATTSARLSPLAAEIAHIESLTAHAAAAECRIGGNNPAGTNQHPAFSKFHSRTHFSAESLVRAHVREMRAYEPVMPLEVLSQRLGHAPGAIVKLDANENPYGPPAAVRRALATMPYLHIYPDPQCIALREALATYTGVPAANLLVGAGADELIDLVMRLFLDPGDAILNCPPTFGMYAFDADLNAARVLAVPRGSDFSLDLAAIERAVLAERPKLLFVASPNNPDGSLLPPPALERLLALPVVVVLDEAYVEFAPAAASRVGDVLRYDNLIVLRTFSKWAGLAGLRVGYGAFPAGLMPHLWKIKQPYSPSVAAGVAARAALEHVAELDAVGRVLVAERQRLYAALQTIPYLDPYPSQANFILCRVAGRDAGDLKAALAQAGILVRYFNKPGLNGHIRISVGRPEHTTALLRALKQLE